MPTSFVLISDQREVRWLRAGLQAAWLTYLCHASRHNIVCLEVKKDLKHMREGWGDKGKRQQQLYTEEPCKSTFNPHLSGLHKFGHKVPLLLSVWKSHFRSRHVVVWLNLALLFGSSDCDILSSLALSMCNTTVVLKISSLHAPEHAGMKVPDADIVLLSFCYLHVCVHMSLKLILYKYYSVPNKEV